MNLKPETIYVLKTQIDLCEKYDTDKDAASWGYEEGVLISVNQAKEILSALEGYHKTEWVSVRNNPPIAKGGVLVWVGDPVNKPIKHFYTSRGKWICMESITMPKYYVVDYWMPLPPAPNTKP